MRLSISRNYKHFIKDIIIEIEQDIPWKEMSSMRDKLIHAYFGIDDEILWQTIKEDIPSIKSKIEKIFKEC